MTIQLTRAVVRQTAMRDVRTGKPVMLRLEVGGRVVHVWPKGCRRISSGYTVTIEQIYLMGAKNKAAEIKMAKEQKKRERQKARQR